MTTLEQELLLWLDDVEQAAADFERRLEAGQPAALRAVPVPADLHPSSLPPALLPRARQAFERLVLLTARVEDRRNQLANDLSTIPRPRHRPASGYSYEIGTGLDVAG